MINFLKNKFILIIIFCVAIYFRVNAYLINNSFFTDEVLLALNVLNRNFIELIQPLNYFQSAPYLFLIMTKIVVSVTGVNELCFRLIPFVSSILSVIIFYMLCDFIFEKTWTKYIALFSFAINYQLLFYSQVFKQYSTDVLFVVLFVYLALKYQNKFDSLKICTLGGIFSAIGLMFSFPLFFVIPSIYVSLLIFHKNQWLKLLYSSIYPVFSIVVYYVLNLGFVKNSEHLLGYWADGFKIFSISLYKDVIYFLFFYEPLHILLVILVILGFYFIFRKNHFCFCVISFTLIISLLAAYLKLYPLSYRLTLYLLPILIILYVAPLDDLPKNRFGKTIILLVTSIYLITGYFSFLQKFVTGKISYLRQDVKPLLEILSKDKNDNEKIYLYYGSVNSYFYYSLFKNIPKKDLILPTSMTDNNSDFFLKKDLSLLPEGKYYLLFVKGTGTFEKDMNSAEIWLKNNTKIIYDKKLKSARLMKILK